VRNFVNIMTKHDIDVDLECGRYIVDAKSIMGIFSLDLMNPIKLTAHSDNEAVLDALFKDIEPFIEK
jgi:phosphotransferase system HPr-like phosphotransfer protein